MSIVGIDINFNQENTKFSYQKSGCSLYYIVISQGISVQTIFFLPLWLTTYYIHSSSSEEFNSLPIDFKEYFFTIQFLNKTENFVKYINFFHIY